MEKVTQNDLKELVGARREALNELNNHLKKEVRELLIDRFKGLINDLEAQIADSLEIFLSSKKKEARPKKAKLEKADKKVVP